MQILSFLINKIKTAFKETFKTEPLMIFSPGRINIIGEHTDYNDGFVFPAAVDKGIYAAISKGSGNSCLVIASDLMQKFESLRVLFPAACSVSIIFAYDGESIYSQIA